MGITVTGSLGLDIGQTFLVELPEDIEMREEEDKIFFLGLDAVILAANDFFLCQTVTRSAQLRGAWRLQCQVKQITRCFPFFDTLPDAVMVFRDRDVVVGDQRTRIAFKEVAHTILQCIRKACLLNGQERELTCALLCLAIKGAHRRMHAETTRANH